MSKKFIIISVVLIVSLVMPQVIFAQTQNKPQSSFLAGLSEVIKGLQEQVLSLQKQIQEILTKRSSESSQPLVVSPMPSIIKPTPAVLEKAGPAPTETLVQLKTLPTKPVVSCVLPEINIGERNNSVYLLQQTLKDTGYYPEGLVTGYYGDLTKKAVERFEKEQGLVPDGQLDKNTTSVLNQKIKKIIPQCGGGAGAPTIQAPLPATVFQEIDLSRPSAFVGIIKSIGFSIMMWGTHTLEIDIPKCPEGAYCMPAITSSYTVKAVNNKVLSDLKKYENQKVTISGKAEYNNLEGGFFGLTAYEVNLIDSTPSFTNITCTSPYVLSNGICVLPSTSIIVLSPNEGEKWEIGKTYDIKWRSSGYSSSTEIKIALQDTRYDPFSESPLGGVVIISTQNTGSYIWTIPSELKDSLGRIMKLGAGNVYKMEVFFTRPGGECKSEKCDASDTLFSIAPQ